MSAIGKYGAVNVKAAVSVQERTCVPAVVTLAQFDLESSCGKHMPAGSNNPFGIKAVGNEPNSLAMTWEVEHGQNVRVAQRFAKFPNMKAAFEAHAAILLKPLYAAAILAWKEGDLDRGIVAMAKHYATDPNYASKLISIIATDQLTALVRPFMVPAAVASRPPSQQEKPT